MQATASYETSTATYKTQSVASKARNLKLIDRKQPTIHTSISKMNSLTTCLEHFIRSSSVILVYNTQIWSTKVYNVNFKIASYHLSPSVSIYEVKEERDILHTRRRGKGNGICHILRGNCHLKHVIEGRTEGRIEVTGRHEGRRKQLLDDLKETKGYWKFGREAVDGALWRSHSGRGKGPAFRQTEE